MATATAKKKVVETIEGVTLELSKREADYLMKVFGNIAGSAHAKATSGAPVGTGPGDAIFEALRDAGAEFLSDVDVGHCCVNFRASNEPDR